MDSGKFVTRHCVHMELPVSDYGKIFQGDRVIRVLIQKRNHQQLQGSLDISAGFLIPSFNYKNLYPGVFCGEELLILALDPHQSFIPPSSTCTVKANYKVGAFALIADLKFVIRCLYFSKSQLCVIMVIMLMFVFWWMFGCKLVLIYWMVGC